MENLFGDAMTQVERLRKVPGVGGLATSLPDWDGELWRKGSERLRGRMKTPGGGAGGGDVYLATQLYAEGGHTALIGDFVRALPGGNERSQPRLIVTNIHDQHETELEGSIQARTEISRNRTKVLSGEGLEEGFDQLAAELLAAPVGRLFLFHHPEDPLASAIAHPEITPLRFLVHHADAVPSLGMAVPGVRIIDLNPYASAQTRLQGLVPELLPLTAPDPGERTVPFMESGSFVTASCGSPHKFIRDYAYGYGETVAVVLRETNGVHVHIGPLKRKHLEQIGADLEQAGLKAEQFVHVPRVDSLAEALWEHRCDLYFSSFPVDGARTNVDVSASGTPILRHVRSPAAYLFEDELAPKGIVSWRTWEDLREALRMLKNVDVLRERSALVRKTYESIHHPVRFREVLERIVAGGSGIEDPHQEYRDRGAVRAALRANQRAAASLHFPAE